MFFKGDSGGPVFEYRMTPAQGLEAVLIGVVNFGSPNCSITSIEPSAAANVAFHRNWIEQKLGI